MKKIKLTREQRKEQKKLLKAEKKLKKQQAKLIKFEKRKQKKDEALKNKQLARIEEAKRKEQLNALKLQRKQKKKQAKAEWKLKKQEALRNKELVRIEKAKKKAEAKKLKLERKKLRKEQAKIAKVKRIEKANAIKAQKQKKRAEIKALKKAKKQEILKARELARLANKQKKEHQKQLRIQRHIRLVKQKELARIKKAKAKQLKKEERVEIRACGFIKHNRLVKNLNSNEINFVNQYMSDFEKLVSVISADDLDINKAREAWQLFFNERTKEILSDADIISQYEHYNNGLEKQLTSLYYKYLNNKDWSHQLIFGLMKNKLRVLLSKFHTNIVSEKDYFNKKNSKPNDLVNIRLFKHYVKLMFKWKLRLLRSFLFKKINHKPNLPTNKFFFYLAGMTGFGWWVTFIVMMLLGYLPSLFSQTDNVYSPFAIASMLVFFMIITFVIFGLCFMGSTSKLDAVKSRRDFYFNFTRIYRTLDLYKINTINETLLPRSIGVKNKLLNKLEMEEWNAFKSQNNITYDFGNKNPNSNMLTRIEYKIYVLWRSKRANAKQIVDIVNNIIKKEEDRARKLNEKKYVQGIVLREYQKLVKARFLDKVKRRALKLQRKQEALRFKKLTNLQKAEELENSKNKKTKKRLEYLKLKEMAKLEKKEKKAKAKAIRLQKWRLKQQVKDLKKQKKLQAKKERKEQKRLAKLAKKQKKEEANQNQETKNEQ